MPIYDLRILLETVEGKKTSYFSSGSSYNSFVDTDTDGLVLSSSQAYGRITGSVSCSFVNDDIFTGTVDTNKVFKQNNILSASLVGNQNTGSIVFTAKTDEYDRLLRYKFIGEKVCNVLGLPNSQWIYTDQVRFPVDDESNVFQGNIDVNTAFVSDTLTFANNANINSDVQFLIDTGSDRYIKFIDERGSGALGLIMGYDKSEDIYEINSPGDKTFNILNFNKVSGSSTSTGSFGMIEFADGTSQTTAGGGGSGTPGGSNTQVQFNDGGSFEGDAGFTYDKDDNSITAINNITASGTISASGGNHTLGGFQIIESSDSGSIAVSGSVKIQPQTTVPALSESRLYNVTSENGLVVDDLHFGTAGLTPAYTYVTLDDDGTAGTGELIYGVGSAVTSTTYNMRVVHDTSTNGTRIYSQLDGVYKVTGNFVIEGASATYDSDIKVDGTDVHTYQARVHSAVDPVERTQIYVGTINSGSYVTATIDATSTANVNYELGSVLLVERLS